MIRKIRREEVPACVRIIRNSHQTVADAFGITVESAPRYVAFATDENRLLWHMDSEHRLMFVEEENGILRGYYSLLLKEDHECELGNLSVLPEYRHRGIGTALLQHAIRIARAQDCSTMHLSIVEENSILRRWYEQNGAVHTGTEKFDFFPFTCGYMMISLTAAGMRLLFEMDKKDYSECTRTLVRNSARSILIRDGKVAMVHSLKYDYYKFPGGGIEKGERPADAMIRETREEAGLVVIPETVREYGYVHRIQKSDWDADECFVQDNYYYLGEAENEPVSQELDDYEAKESYRLEYIDPATAIRKNRALKNSPYNRLMFEREALVLEMLQSEGLL